MLKVLKYFKLKIFFCVLEKSLILLNDVNFSQENFRGCPDWNCEVTFETSQSDKADAIIGNKEIFTLRSDQYFVYYSQVFNYIFFI